MKLSAKIEDIQASSSVCLRCSWCSYGPFPENYPLCPIYWHEPSFTFSGGGYLFLALALLEDKIDFNQSRAQILVEEEERLFEQLVVGYPYSRAPFITARICGICPTAHYLASIKAIERAFELKPAPAVIKLREILAE